MHKYVHKSVPDVYHIIIFFSLTVLLLSYHAWMNTSRAPKKYKFVVFAHNKASVLNMLKWSMLLSSGRQRKIDYIEITINDR